MLAVIVIGSLAFALAPEQGVAAVVMLAVGVALFVAEVGLGIADHLRSSGQSDGR